jgi:hypothetical protein
LLYVRRPGEIRVFCLIRVDPELSTPSVRFGIQAGDLLIGPLLLSSHDGIGEHEQTHERKCEPSVEEEMTHKAFVRDGKHLDPRPEHRCAGQGCSAHEHANQDLEERWHLRGRRQVDRKELG